MRRCGPPLRLAGEHFQRGRCVGNRNVSRRGGLQKRLLSPVDDPRFRVSSVESRLPITIVPLPRPWPCRCRVSVSVDSTVAWLLLLSAIRDTRYEADTDRATADSQLRISPPQRQFYECYNYYRRYTFRYLRLAWRNIAVALSCGLCPVAVGSL